MDPLPMAKRRALLPSNVRLNKQSYWDRPQVHPAKYSAYSSSQKQMPGKSLKTGQAYTKSAFNHLQLRDSLGQKWLLCIW